MKEPQPEEHASLRKMLSIQLLRITCGTEVCNGLDQTVIYTESILNQRFTIAGDSRGQNMDTVAAKFIQLVQLLLNAIARQEGTVDIDRQ